MTKATKTDADTSAAAAVKYPLDKLRQNALAVFGVTTSTFAGATSDLPDGEYSIEEIKSKISDWRKKGAK